MARRELRFLSIALFVLVMTVGSLFTVGGSGSLAFASSSATCTSRLLVLSAMPLEMDPILAHAQIDPGSLTVVNDRYFVTGTLEGNAVIMGLTGIGPENAQTTTTEAIDHYAACGVSGVVFSGTSGGDDIGNVFVPNQWDYVDGATGAVSYTEHPNSAMLGAARSAVSHGDVQLRDTTPTGDAACACAETNPVQTPITLKNTPTVEFGLTGNTTDPFDGHPLPCFPAGSDVFGCVPCRELDHSQLVQALAFAEESPAFVDPSFFTSYIQAASPSGYVQDNETAVVAKVAAQRNLPSIGFRAASDGPGNNPGTGGDPLDLPGYPAQFLVYRQLAADNAAAMTLGFLKVWAGGHVVPRSG
jgi:nucleoside phosphorylase